MGHAERLNAAMFEHQKQDQELARRAAEAIVNLVNGFACTVIVTTGRPGAKTPSFGCDGFTIYGSAMRMAQEELQEEIALKHMETAMLSLTSQTDRVKAMIDQRRAAREKAKEPPPEEPPAGGGADTPPAPEDPDGRA